MKYSILGSRVKLSLMTGCVVGTVLLLCVPSMAQQKPSATAKSQPAPNLCQSYRDEIEHALKLIANAKTDSFGDNSAARYTNTLMVVNNELSMISLNLNLLEKSGCSTSGLTFPHGAYLGSAIKCATARLKSDSSSDKSPAECEFKNYQR